MKRSSEEILQNTNNLVNLAEEIVQARMGLDIELSTNPTGKLNPPSIDINNIFNGSSNERIIPTTTSPLTAGYTIPQLPNLATTIEGITIPSKITKGNVGGVVQSTLDVVGAIGGIASGVVSTLGVVGGIAGGVAGAASGIAGVAGGIAGGVQGALGAAAAIGSLELPPIPEIPQIPEIPEIPKIPKIPKLKPLSLTPRKDVGKSKKEKAAAKKAPSIKGDKIPTKIPAAPKLPTPPTINIPAPPTIPTI